MVRLAVSEAVSNVVVHSYRGGRPGPVTVCAEARDEVMTIVIADEGCGVSPSAPSPGAGLGLPIIAELADSLSMSPGSKGRGTRVQMTFGLTG